VSLGYDTTLVRDQIYQNAQNLITRPTLCLIPMTLKKWIYFLIVWRRHVYDIDAQGYITALTKYNLTLLGYLYSVNVEGSYR
jgi:hypothetical protein